MILSNSTEMISYTTASKMAATFEHHTQELVQCMQRIRELTSELGDVMNVKTGYDFAIGFEMHNRNVDPASIPKRFKLAAWKCIIEHVGIRKIMSSKRQKQLDAILYSHDPDQADQLPELSEDTILQVLEGYASSADEFLEESIREEYDWLRPYNPERSKLKTDKKNFDKLSRKVILPYCVHKSWRTWDVEYERQRHIMAVDNIFHLLDGKGMVKGHRGPLLDSIRTSEGSGETEFFSFRCFYNRNLHLTFKRQDLLDKFNAICGRNYIGSNKY